ncbi:Thiamine-monophosphate kinase [hydrothermal vent metagenome]|uniref:Thiamine-monophosphate kinase n=1 Tax=hydrothermal vent metagenome TaxID=652676 RepID=A0A3B1E9L6_9ZZZZ
MNKENYFIKQFIKKRNNFIGDDGAVIGNQVFSTDSFFENVHFKCEWMSLKQIAIKAMLVNVSDVIVMNSVPKYALLAVAIPNYFTKKDLRQLASGFKQVAKEFEIEIIGGDTISNDKLDISITIISECKKPVLRSGTKKSDLVCYTGKIGSCKKDLKKLLKGEKIDKKSKFITPQLKPNFFYEIAPYISSALDISDGLFFELERLSRINNVDFIFSKNIPTNKGCSGEEYEILFTFNQNAKKDIKKIAKKHNIKLTIFAKAINGQYKSTCKDHHFAR